MREEGVTAGQSLSAAGLQLVQGLLLNQKGNLQMTRWSKFIRYCLSGLEAMYIPSERIFSASSRMVGEKMVNIRDYNQEYKYTMNSLMGLLRLRTNGTPVFLDIESDYQRLARRVKSQARFPENIAATIWTGMCLGTEVPAQASSLFQAIIESASGSGRLTAQGLAWSIAALLEGVEEHWDKAREMILLAKKLYVHPESGLVRHLPTGLRRDWAAFAASCYMAYAFLLFGRKTGSEEAKETGLRIIKALVRLQGPQGQWAWFYHVPSGRVVDYYPVYSVHQHAMAPFFLLEAIDQGYSEFREPLVKGFRWILGDNELGQHMVERTHHVIWRSIKRQGNFEKLTRVARAAGVRYTGLKSTVEIRNALRINHECRSYELGWALWAFSGRHDFDEILNDPCFV